MTRIPRIDPAKNAGRRMILELRIHETKEFERQRYPEEIREKAEGGTLTLEDILRLAQESSLQILLFGFDVFSGARRMFESKRYSIGDIKSGRFDRHGLEVIE